MTFLQNTPLKRLLVALVFLMSGCSAVEKEVFPPDANETTFNDDISVAHSLSRDSSLKELSELWRLTRPIVGIAQHKQFEVPFVLPPTVRDENIVFQIYRCPASLTIQGAIDVFDEESELLLQQASALSYFKGNKFWRDIVLKCTSLSEAHPQSELFDLTARTGEWKYYLRPCISNHGFSSFSCSDYIASTRTLREYYNDIDSEKQTRIDSINNKLVRIREISAAMPGRAAALAEAYSRCDTSDWDRAKRMLKRSVIANIVGYGSSILLKIFSPKPNGFPLPGTTWGEIAKYLWEPTKDPAKSGQAVTRILLWLFTAQEDFKRVCSTAEEIKLQTLDELNKMKELQFLLAAEMDEAQRLGLDFPEGYIP